MVRSAASISHSRVQGRAAVKTVGIIPARLASSRLPRKLLLQETGKTLLQHTWEAAQGAKLLDELVIATDSREIAEVATAFGADVELTGEHPSGTDRIAEVVNRRYRHADVVINLQADEPEMDAEHVDLLAAVMLRDKSAEMATLASPIRDTETLVNPARVKVVRSTTGQALYFSRQAIPFSRDIDIAELLTDRAERSPWLLHIGIYAYRPNTLLRLTQLPQSVLERLECLEQLRALDNGIGIHVGVVQHMAAGIDTPADYKQFIARRSAA